MNRVPNHKKDIQVLQWLGLTNSQATVYLTLVALEQAKARTIWTLSKVARQDIYRILAELMELGLVEKIIQTPNEFKAISIMDGVSILLQRRHKKYLEMHGKAMDLMQRYKDKNVRAKLQEGESQFILIPEGEAVVLRTTKALENAQTSMDSIISWNKFSYFMVNARKFRLQEAMRRGVKIRFITEKPEDEKQLPKIVETFEKNFEVRYLLAAPSAHVGLFDEKEVFINTSTTGGLTETPLLWSNNPSLVAVVQDYFETAWITATEANIESFS